MNNAYQSICDATWGNRQRLNNYAIRDRDYSINQSPSNLNSTSQVYYMLPKLDQQLLTFCVEIKSLIEQVAESRELILIMIKILITICVRAMCNPSYVVSEMIFFLSPSNIKFFYVNCKPATFHTIRSKIQCNFDDRKNRFE
jgi:hypothetical protein